MVIAPAQRVAVHLLPDMDHFMEERREDQFVRAPEMIGFRASSCGPPSPDAPHKRSGENSLPRGRRSPLLTVAFLRDNQGRGAELHAGTQ